MIKNHKRSEAGMAVIEWLIIATLFALGAGAYFGVSSVPDEARAFNKASATAGPDAAGKAFNRSSD